MTFERLAGGSTGGVLAGGPKQEVRVGHPS